MIPFFFQPINLYDIFLRFQSLIPKKQHLSRLTYFSVLQNNNGTGRLRLTSLSFSFGGPKISKSPGETFRGVENKKSACHHCW